VGGAGGQPPDTLPLALNADSALQYPRELWDKRVQGNVTLRIFVDTVGRLAPDSTSVVESSGYPGLDSAAVKGAAALRFRPAKKGDRPMAVSILFPVWFRHPEMPALPGDSVLKPRGKPN
jgi:protein TonB